MNANQAREIVYARFVSIWSPTPSVSYVFDNEKFDSEALTEWVHVLVSHVGGGQHTIGQPPYRIFRRMAQLIVVFRVAADKGMARLDELAQIVRTGFEGQTISDVWFTDAEYTESGSTRDGFRTGTLVVSFTYDEEK